MKQLKENVDGAASHVSRPISYKVTDGCNPHMHTCLFPKYWKSFAKCLLLPVLANCV